MSACRQVELIKLLKFRPTVASHKLLWIELNLDVDLSLPYFLFISLALSSSYGSCSSWILEGALSEE